MEIKDILKMNPESECEITYNGSETWENCYYQLKNNSNINLESNDLPLLDDKYLADAGEGLKNNNGDFVYDPNQDIKFEEYLDLNFKEIYTSKTFIGLIQAKIKELIDSDEIDIDDELNELWDELGLYHLRGFVSTISSAISCKDLIFSEQSEENLYLWFTSSQMDGNGGNILIEEINN